MSSRGKVRVRLVLSPRDEDEPNGLLETAADILWSQPRLMSSLKPQMSQNALADERAETSVRASVQRFLEEKHARLRASISSTDIRSWAKFRATCIMAAKKRVERFRKSVSANGWKILEVSVKGAVSAALDFVDKKGRGG